jgi:hypothetical protein
MKSSRIRWEGHVERLEENRDPWRVLARKSEGKYNLEELSVKGGNNKYILRYEDVRACTGLIWVQIGLSEHSNKLSGSI